MQVGKVKKKDSRKSLMKSIKNLIIVLLAMQVLNNLSGSSWKYPVLVLVFFMGDYLGNYLIDKFLGGKE